MNPIVDSSLETDNSLHVLLNEVKDLSAKMFTSWVNEFAESSFLAIARQDGTVRELAARLWGVGA